MELPRFALKGLLAGSSEKVFCISMQRTGTTSVGRFFRDFGYKWAGWPADEKNDWSASWCQGDYEKIFTSADFRSATAYEDSPWWFPDFYRILFHRFPGSRFILFIRDPDAWFRSMVKHSGNNIIGRAEIHCKAYRRELEYLELLHGGVIDEQVENRMWTEKTMKLEGFADHYKAVYRRHNLEVQEFFRKHAPEALHVGQLEDPLKWVKLGKFLGVAVPSGYEYHENISKAD